MDEPNTKFAWSKFERVLSARPVGANHMDVVSTQFAWSKLERMLFMRPEGRTTGTW